jgi:1-acyl-sn-glycerol-3-phosphate acyltransferase
MKKIIATIILKLWGWKIEGGKALEKKLMIVVMPHTSNWDFPLGIFARWKMGIEVKFVGKSSLFKSPYGFIMRALGGYPVERNPAKKNGSIVDQIIDIINNEDEIRITFTPEGTRSKVKRLRSGFYTIAKATGIKIQLVAIDYQNKILRFDVPHIPAGTFEEELKILKEFYKGVKGKYPEKTFDFGD